MTAPCARSACGGARSRTTPALPAGHPRHARSLCARGERLDRRRAAGFAPRSSWCSARRSRGTPVDSLLWGKTMGLCLSLNWRTELSRQALAGQAAAAADRRAVAALGRPRPAAGRPAASANAAPMRPQTCCSVLPALPRAVHAAEHRLQRMGGGRPPHRDRRAAAGRRPASGVRLSRHLVSGAHRDAAGRRWPAPPRPACRSWCSATTATSPGPSPPPAPTCRTCSSRRRPATASTRRRTARARSSCARSASRCAAQPDEILTVRETRHGPVISDLRGRGGPILARRDGQPRARRHRRRRPARAEPARRTSRRPARPRRDDHLAGAEPAGGRPPDASRSTSPAACRSGAPATAPRRCPGDGAHDWIGWASGEQLPHIVAPESGRLVNANERIAPPDFPVFLGRDWFGDWRARRDPRIAGSVGPA